MSDSDYRLSIIDIMPRPPPPPPKLACKLFIISSLERNSVVSLDEALPFVRFVKHFFASQSVFQRHSPQACLTFHKLGPILMS